MDAQYTLVRIYLFVCRRYRQSGLWTAAPRQTGNADPDFTDEEVLTIYLFGIIKHRKTIREIYDYVRDHFADWFPELGSYSGPTELGSYGGYNQRLNRLSAVFAPLVSRLSAKPCQK